MVKYVYSLRPARFTAEKSVNDYKEGVILDNQRININKIQDKTNDIKNSVNLLRNYAHEEDENFVSNPEKIGAARYYFVMLIEACMNIANHFCTRLLEKAPANYAETFLLLGEHSYINLELAERLAQMARFRNLLVHGYAKVDDRKLLQIIREDLTDVDNFLKEIGKIINNG